jgi:hypothetical protein
LQYLKAMQKLSIRQFLTMFEEDNLMGNSGRTIKEKWITYIQSRQKNVCDWQFKKSDEFLLYV